MHIYSCNAALAFLCARKAPLTQCTARAGIPNFPSFLFSRADGISKNHPQLCAAPPIQSFQSFLFYFFFSS